MPSTNAAVINFPGGIISPGHLLQVMEITASAQISDVRFGNRQQLLIDVPSKKFEIFSDECAKGKINFSTEPQTAPNIVSSYTAAVFISDTWLSEGVFKDIFDMFDYQPGLKINLCHSDQTFVPFFTGHINWIASKQQHFWYLYIRFPKTNKIFCCPELIYTNDIVRVSKATEELMMEQSASSATSHTDGYKMYHTLKTVLHPIIKPIEQELRLPVFHLPYYEGFNKYGNNYWIGIYRRNELFSVEFLKDLSRLCLDTKIGELYATTWKSLIIKGIADEDRKQWDYLLGKYRINVRHAANELNWRVEDNNEDGLVLKRHIIRYFDKEDVRTYGLCFSIETRQRPGVFGSVIIRRQMKNDQSRLKSFDRYTLLYTADFNPNSTDYILFRDNVEKEHLGPYIVSLCKMFYERKNEHRELIEVVKPPMVTEHQKPLEKLMYQCKHCLTAYIVAVGDPENGIAAGTAFADLPVTYSCNVCQAPKAEFVEVYEGVLS